MTIIPPLFALPKSKDNKGLYLFDEKIHLGYFGSFYDGVRSPKPFLDFLLDLHKVDPTLFDKIQIHFFGQQNRFSAPLFSAYPTIRRYFILHGYVDRDTSINAMQKMDVLLNFGNTTDYHLPSKVVDLLYINKPIVNFTAHKNDTTQVFLADYDPILNINLSDKTTNYNDVFLDFILKKRSETQVAFHDMKQYLPENIGEQYIKAIE